MSSKIAGRRRGLALLVLGFTLACTISGARFALADNGLGRFLPAAVTVEIQDASGKALRSVNGTVVPEGVFVPLSSLAGAAKAQVKSRDGSTWTVTNYLALHQGIGLALLEIPKVPEYALTYPPSGAFQPDSKVTILLGPGSAADSVSAVLHFTFALRTAIDFIAVTPGATGAAPVFDMKGRFLGVADDISIPGYPAGVVIPVVSVQAVAHSGSTPNPISSIANDPPAPWEDPKTATGMTFRAASILTAKRGEDARSLLAKAIDADPKLVDAHFWMGRALMVLERWDESADEFQQATKLDPNYHLAWHMAGAAYNQGAKYLDAEKMYLKALEVKPNAAETYCNLGGAYFNEHRQDKAAEAFKKSIELDPRYQYGLAYHNLAQTYKAMGRTADAEQVYQSLLKVYPESAARLRQILDGTN